MAIRKWVLKAVAQKVISFLPYRNRINYWFQRNITKGVQLDEEHLHWKLTHARDHLTYFRQFGRGEAPVCLELGTGWYPIVPIMLFLHGAKKVYTIDVNPHLTKDTLQTSIEKIFALVSSGKLEHLFPQIREDRWEILQELKGDKNGITLPEMLETINIKAVIGDARQIPKPDHSLDLICSNNTFEHIYPEILSDILREFKRLLKPGGVMSHFVDLSDHFAHFDHSITIYNFLRYSTRQWSRIDNIIQPQNRWRWPQYRSLYQSLNIPVTEESVRPGELEALKSITLHPEWAAFSEAELAISHGYLVSVL